MVRGPGVGWAGSGVSISNKSVVEFFCHREAGVMSGDCLPVKMSTGFELTVSQTSLHIGRHLAS